MSWFPWGGSVPSFQPCEAGGAATADACVGITAAGRERNLGAAGPRFQEEPRASPGLPTLPAEQGTAAGMGGLRRSLRLPTQSRSATHCQRHRALPLGSFSVQGSSAGSCLCHQLAASAEGQEGIVCACWHKRLKLKGEKKKEKIKEGKKNQKQTDKLPQLHLQNKTQPGTAEFSAVL